MAVNTPGVLDGVIKPYSWGSTDSLAAMMGTTSTTTPQAELWFGTHPRGPATLLRPAASRNVSSDALSGVSPDVLRLDEVIAADPQSELGQQVARKFAGKLPFLLKVLAVARPLSLQVHPNAFEAQAGFEAEEQQGVRVDAAHRSFVDRNHKPELICALEPFTVLCGFREPVATAKLLRGLGVLELEPAVKLLQANHSQASDQIQQVLAWLWGLDVASGAELAQQVAQACDDLVHVGSHAEFHAEMHWAARLAEHHEGDVGVVVALMLNLVTLQPGQALFLEAGRLHCYLEGMAVEIMANSDNVLRGGLTQKHVDTNALLEVLDCRPSDVALLTPTASTHTFRPPVAEFRLIRMEVSRPVRCVNDGPEIALCVAGCLSVANQKIRGGQAVWVPASSGDFEVAGEGLLFRAMPGDS
ncbi:MAG: mannose-6-phosphate isomerase, class I [Acidimicrobiia bacterium]|nr:mannose-6-phosphate isomerase, class I [Acidimicrobiia bacterium]